jgi:hypothetical protein
VLLIRPEQMQRIEAVMLNSFEGRVLEHIRQYFPTHWRVIGPQQMQQVVSSGLKRARDGGYPAERDGYMFVTLMLFFGSHFADDPQYPWLAATLNSNAPAESSVRLENAFDAAMAFLSEAGGPHHEHRIEAYARARTTLLQELESAPQISSDYVLNTLKWIWPQKYQLVGERDLRRLMQSVVKKGASRGVGSSDSALVRVVASFLFGHGIAEDRQFPALAGVLSQQSNSRQLREALIAQLAALSE